jgi:hypothetical protein
MKKAIPIALYALVAACADQTAVLYDDPYYPPENTAVIASAPDNVGKVVITAAGGQPLRCGGWLSRSECQSVRLLPGTTILRFDYVPAADSRLATARAMDMPITAQGGHTYHIKATVVRDGASGQGAPRVVLQLVDKGLGQPRPEPQ